MFSKYSTRRQFLKYGKLSLLFLLNACSNISKKLKVSFQSSFYPDSFIDILPNSWEKENINFGQINLQNNKKKIYDSDFVLVNDGWLKSINFEEFENIDYLPSFDNLDIRSKDFLNNFENHKVKKLFPIGVIPYAVIIKNNKDLIKSAKQSWDFLLSKNLTDKIILPESPRIIISIAKRMRAKDSLEKLKKQSRLFSDKNSLNWLINSNACVAIVPYSLCLKYSKIDSRLSIVFPDNGVPLMWNFILSKSKYNEEMLIEWLKSLENKANIDKLANSGWYLPFKNNYAQDKYYLEKSEIDFSGPSKRCWDNSWSLPPLDSKQKIRLEAFWNQSLTP